jgi:hypothetical protein
VVDFDWFEESACIEASVVADVPRGLPGRLSWSCDCHEPGDAALVRCEA